MKFSFGKIFQQNKKISSAETFDAEALLKTGFMLHQQGRLNEAMAAYQRLLSVDSCHFDALQLSGLVCYQARDFANAVDFMSKAISINSSNPAVYNNQGLALKELRQFDQARVSYEQAIRLNAEQADFHLNLANLRLETRHFEQAIDGFDRVIQLDATCLGAYANRGVAFYEIKRFDEALRNFDHVIAVKPDYADVYNNRGVVLKQMKRFEEALASFTSAIEFDPDNAQAYSNRGTVLRALNRFDEALASYDKAIALKANHLEAHINRGVLLQAVKRLDEALNNYDAAIALNADSAEAHHNRGSVLQDLGKHAQALASYERAFTLNPNYEFLLGTVMHMKMRLCLWEGFSDDCQKLKVGIEARKRVVPSFPILAMFDSPELQRISAEIWVRENCPENPSLGELSKHLKGEKIRVGYFSGDLRTHAVALLAAGLFEAHDKTRFEIVAFSYGHVESDQMTQRLKAAFDHFVDCKSKSDQEVAQMARDMAIDFAVDLGGHTQGARAGIFAVRAAPVQVNYLGYPATMGAPYMDYIIADRQIVPEKFTNNYTEKVVYLPCYQVNDNKKKIAEKCFTRHELGLPEQGFIFCSFNQNFKITPEVFGVWMAILRIVDGSVLWLLEDNSAVSKHLCAAAENHGINPQRLVFAKRMDVPEYLARYRVADLFLDTLPFNAGTTASDALWAGLPVLTCMGNAFAGRMAGSLLYAVGLSELITHTREAYVALAVTLAKDAQRLHAIRAKLHQNRQAALLFDTKSFTGHLEAAYVHMYDRCQANLPPTQIEVTSLPVNYTFNNNSLSTISRAE